MIGRSYYLLPLLLAVPAVALMAGTAEDLSFATVPPAAHTGGFSEPTCHTCHFDEALDAPGGGLTLEGLPSRYSEGERYRLVVRLTRSGMQRSGFQLAARYGDGSEMEKQAGTLRPLDERVAITEPESGVLYASHSQAGSWPIGEKDTEWTLEWTAPVASAPVLIHLVGNAANGDDSPFGDFIYAQSFRSEPYRPAP